MLITNVYQSLITLRSYDKWYKGYSYNKSIPKFDFQELGMLITNVYQSLIS